MADAYVLAADTVVAVGRRILVKPRFVEEELATLQTSRRPHKAALQPTAYALHPGKLCPASSVNVVKETYALSCFLANFSVLQRTGSADCESIITPFHQVHVRGIHSSPHPHETNHFAASLL